MEQPPTTSPGAAERPILVRIDVADVGALWRRDPELSWEALNQLEGLLETLLEDLGGSVLDSDTDAFVLQFEAPEPAIMWCARTQEGLLALDWPTTIRANFDASGAADMLFGGLLARMAVHAGTMHELDQLASLAQPGQVLISEQTFSRVSAPIPPDLQIRPVGNARVGQSAVEILAVTTRLLSRRRFGPLPSQARALPVPAYCFVGRRTALGDLAERFEAGSRMVNITGAEGTGKTRLAIQWTLQQPVTQQTAMVPLSIVDDEDELMLATALALGLSLHQDGSAPLSERVRRALASKGPLVLILDDWPDSLSPMPLAGWLHAAPALRLLVTSRSPLSSTAATHLHLGALDDADASALFLARTHRRWRGGERPTHASSIELPEHLDGLLPGSVEQQAGIEPMPLALPHGHVLLERKRAADTALSVNERIDSGLSAVRELSRMGLAHVALDILHRLEPLLTEGSPRQAEWDGHRTDTLIAGGQLEAAQAALDGGADGTMEWTIRRAQLALAEENFADCIAMLREHPATPEVSHLLGQALTENGEWEEAEPYLHSAAEGLDDAGSASRAWADLGRVLSGLGKEEQAEDARLRAVAAGGEAPQLMARLAADRFESASARMELTSAADHLDEAIRLFLLCGDRGGAAKSLLHAGDLWMIRHDPARARTVLSQARDICREDGISAMEAEALLGLGIAARMDGDFGTALDAFAEASSLTEGHPVLAAMVNAHRGATEAACDAIENAVDALATAESQLQSGWDAVADTIHDALLGFIDLARAREAKLEDRQDDVDVHVDLALNRLARASSFETRSTPPRGRETPSRLNALRLTRLLLDNALGAIESGA